MKQETFLKKQFILIIVVLIIIMTGILFSMVRYRNYKEYTFYNNARILVKAQLSRIEETVDKNLGNNIENNIKSIINTNYDIKKDEYPAVITDINGEIIYSTNMKYSVGSRVNLNELIQIDQSFFLNNKDVVKVTFTIETSKGNVGFATFFVPRHRAIGKEEWQVILGIFMPLIIAGIIVILLLFINYSYLKRRVIYPVQEMTASSRAIISGDYDIPVVKNSNNRIMSNDIEQLSYNFELMRDELKEKRRREEQLKRSQKELISCISHDLKTPISTIKAYSEGLRDGMADSSEKVQKYSNIIVSKTEVLTKMISDLLEHFNAELNQLKIEKQEQYFNDFIDELSRELEQVVLYKKMNFSYENTAPNLIVNFDRNRITQVIANLIDNSIKYGKEFGGKISINVSYLQSDKNIIIKVMDNGYGIGAMDIPHIFDKFYRGEKSRNLSIPGSGLGLSICKYIIEQHNGDIQCQSIKNEGSSFTITIPVV